MELIRYIDAASEEAKTCVIPDKDDNWLRLLNEQLRIQVSEENYENAAMLARIIDAEELKKKK